MIMMASICVCGCVRVRVLAFIAHAHLELAASYQSEFSKDDEIRVSRHDARTLDTLEKPDKFARALELSSTLKEYDECLKKQNQGGLEQVFHPDTYRWEYSAEIVLHPQLVQHPEYIPVFPYVSQLTGECKGRTHEMRMGDIARMLLRRRPTSCLLVTNHWDALRNWGEILTLKSGDEYAVHNCTVLGFIDGYLGSYKLFVGTRRFVPIPYVENVYAELDTMRAQPRRTLFAFRGAIQAYPARKRLLEMDPSKLPITKFSCKTAMRIVDVERSEQSKPQSESKFSKSELAREMTTSIFCLVLPGDTRSTSRLSDALAAGCIPVIVGSYSNAVTSQQSIADFEDLPFSRTVPYSKFVLRIDEAQWMKDATGTMLALLEQISSSSIRRMQENIENEGSWLLYRSTRSRLAEFLAGSF